ncbi:MAG: hypothetical protein R2747_22680 [Pyrinomonadaceae bacterium]
MAADVAEKIRQTQNSFPAQEPGAVESCPYAKKPTPKESDQPISPATIFSLTQDVAQPASVSPVGAPPPEKPKEKKAWIEIILVDAEGNPMPGVRYRITPPGGGAPQEGRLNEHGQAGLYQIEPGQCKITFPDLDQDAWE